MTARALKTSRSHASREHSEPSLPGRRSFRLTGGAPDPDCGRALLPLWLEESSGACFPVTTDSYNKETDQGLSFDRRWDSLQNNNNNNSCPTQRPPGWEDVSNRCLRVKKNKKSNLCPSVVIKEPDKACPCTPVRHKLPAPPASGRSRPLTQSIYCSSTDEHPLNMGGFSRQLHDVFSDHFVNFPVQQITLESEYPSTSMGTQLTESAQQSSSTLEDKQSFLDVLQKKKSTQNVTQGSSSTSNVTNYPYAVSHETEHSDITSNETEYSYSMPHGTQYSLTSSIPQQPCSSRCMIQQSSPTSHVAHQLSSSLFKVQQSFSKPCVTRKKSFTENAIQQPLTFRQRSHLFSPTGDQQSPVTVNVSQESFPNCEDCHMWLSSDSIFCENLAFSNINCRGDGVKKHHEFAGEAQLRTCHATRLPSSISEGWRDCEKYRTTFIENEKEIALPITQSPCTQMGMPTTPYDYLDITGCTETSTLQIADLPQRQHWVEFENGSTEQGTTMVATPCKIVPRTLTIDDSNSSGEISLKPTPPGSPLDMGTVVFQRTSPINAGNYSSRLIRTYSQRGRRASKRVISSVSRRMSASDYGKLPESRPPLYSKAAMTMQSGPGLFEETPHRTESECPREEKKRPNSESIKAKPSLEKPTESRRVGSMRLPRLPAALLRRSASLSSPHEKSREVPIERLTEQRPGSFRKFLGVLAGSFRRKSNKINNPDTAPDQDLSDNRSVSVPDTNDKQTPHAPRLPRKAAKHSFIINHESDRPASFV